MALWEFTNLNKYGNHRTRIIYTKGGLGISKGFGNFIFAKRFKYKHSHPYIPPALFTAHNQTKYLMPGWKEVHPETTLEDIIWEKPKNKNTPKNKVIEHKFTSSSSDKIYIVKEYKNPDGSITYGCNCFGAIRSRGNCKHIKSLKNKSYE